MLLLLQLFDTILLLDIDVRDDAPCEYCSSSSSKLDLSMDHHHDAPYEY